MGLSLSLSLSPSIRVSPIPSRVSVGRDGDGPLLIDIIDVLMIISIIIGKAPIIIDIIIDNNRKGSFYY